MKILEKNSSTINKIFHSLEEVMVSTISKSDEVFNIIVSNVKKNANKYSVILQMQRNIRDFNEKFEQIIKTSCNLFSKSECLNKVCIDFCDDFEMCKSVITEELSETKKGQKLERNSLENFKCNFDDCNKSYKTRDSLTMHPNIHSGIIFECVWPQCKFGTYFKQQLKRHALIHTNEEKFRCDFENYNKVFLRLDGLKQHKISHSSGRQFICDWNQCFIKFKRKGQVIRHKNAVHLKLKKFKCDYNRCHKRLRNKSDLKSHTFIHSGERPYSCNYEGYEKRFLRSSHQKIHMNRHLGIKKFKCNQCVKSFVESRELKRHNSRYHSA